MSWWVLLAPLAYLLGTFPSADLVARASGIDINTTGSGNPGASNVTRVLGWRKGVIVFALDALKGVIAALVGLGVGGRAGGYVLGFAAVIGHIYPITRRFRGGKGVASAGGVAAVLLPLVFVIITIAWLVISRLTHKAALASIVVVVSTPVLVALSGRPAWEVIASAGLCALVVIRHAGNIHRMLRREEHTLSTRS